jgi:hypothetical protein
MKHLINRMEKLEKPKQIYVSPFSIVPPIKSGIPLTANHPKRTNQTRAESYGSRPKTTVLQRDRMCCFRQAIIKW